MTIKIYQTDEYPYNLGTFGRKISTASTDVQTWFNRGLTWTYTFNHGEAIRCFENAIAHDSSCAIAYWGIAFALGPSYNKPWDLFDDEDRKTTLKRAHEAACTAEALISSDTTPIERGLIMSIQVRFQSEHSASLDQLAMHNRAYADAMGLLYSRFSDDLDVASLYADSMMTLTPWKLYDISTGKPAPGARTLESKAVLERALQQPGSPTHPGLLHMYIHLSEMSPTPERGLNAADHLRNLIPDAGHAHHMPIHLGIQVGYYRRAIESNHRATLADDKFLAIAGPHNFYSLYRMHNYHSLVYAAMFAGKKQVALETVDRMEASLPTEVLHDEVLANWLEGLMAVRYHVMVRFGMWREIIEAELPENQDMLCVTTATIHYAKGVAWAASRNVPEASKSRDLFHESLGQIPITRRTHPNRSIDILRVGAAMLDGEIEYRRGRYDDAFAHLRDSIVLSDNLNYSEPWGWMQPARHAYAALMLEQGYIEEAAEAYKADLGLSGSLARAHHHPNNVWALQGYYECLVRLGRPVDKALESQLKIALAVADVPVKSSCFCRLDTSCMVDGP